MSEIKYYHDDGEDDCPDCGAASEIRTCASCGVQGRIIDCGHMSQPRPIASGLSDGSRLHLTYCEDCANGDMKCNDCNWAGDSDDALTDADPDEDSAEDAYACPKCGSANVEGRDA